MRNIKHGTFSYIITIADGCVIRRHVIKILRTKNNDKFYDIICLKI